MCIIGISPSTVAVAASSIFSMVSSFMEKDFRRVHFASIRAMPLARTSPFSSLDPEAAVVRPPICFAISRS